MTDHGDKYVLAVDGGGSKTTAWIAGSSRHPSQSLAPEPFACESDLKAEAAKIETSGLAFDLRKIEVVGRGEAGPSNPRSVGFEIAFANLEKAVSAAKNEAKLDRRPIAAACLSLAGAGRDEERQRIGQWAESRGFAEKIFVTDDIEPLSLAAEAECSDIVDWSRSITLVVGTGSIALGRKDLAEPVRLGGWGYLLGDEGSGFSIGLAALQSLCRQFDSGIRLDSFHSDLLQELGLTDPRELVGFVYQSPLPRERIAKLSRSVFASSETDPTAARIVGEAVSAMADLVYRTTRRLGFSSQHFPLALSGGVLSGNPSIVTRLLDELKVRACEPLAYHVVQEPILGSLLKALTIAGES